MCRIDDVIDRSKLSERVDAIVDRNIKRIDAGINRNIKRIDAVVDRNIKRIDAVVDRNIKRIDASIGRLNRIEAVDRTTSTILKIVCGKCCYD